MRNNRWFVILLQSAGMISASILLFIFVFLIWESLPFLSQVGPGALILDESWYPLDGLFRILPMLIGSLLVTAGAVLMATPAGIAVALFGRYYAPKILAQFYHRIMELLAGIPSVVYGFWGLVVLVPWIAQYAAPGASLLAGILVLAVMILPLVALTADASMERVPHEWIRGADALALTRWGKIRKIILPVASRGMVSGIVLQVARAMGETMAVLMVCGNIVQIPGSLFEPVRTLTANIALEMSYAMDMHRHALFVSGLVLLILTTLLLYLGNLVKESHAIQSNH